VYYFVLFLELKKIPSFLIVVLYCPQDIQLLLIEAHDIVGVASPIMLQKELDQFNDMTALESKFTLLNSAWNTVLEALAVEKTLLTARIANANIGA